MRIGIRKANNAGLLITTAGPDLLHTIQLVTSNNMSVPNKTVVIRKILWYNNTGASVTLIFGTRDLAVAPAFVALFPTMVAFNGLPEAVQEADIPAIEFTRNNAALAAGRSGDIYVQASAVGVVIALEVEEF
jgi:hypothetical protein